MHGGLRYLKQGKFRLTRASVRERQELLHEGPGLIDPLGFLLSVYKGDFPGRLTFALGLTVYDLLALRWDHAYYSPKDFQLLAPHVARRNLECGFRYGDAQTDDARLTLRILHEACAESCGQACALNYVRAESLLRSDGQVVGAVLHDLEADLRAEVHAARRDQRHRRLGGHPAQPARRRNPHPSAARLAPDLSRLAAAVGAGGQLPAPPRPPPGVHLPLGGRDPGRNHRRRSFGQPGRRACHQPRGSVLPDGRGRNPVPFPAPRAGGCAIDLCRGAPGDWQRGRKTHPKSPATMWSGKSPDC